MYFRRFPGTKTLEWYGIFVLKSGPVNKTLSETFCDTYFLLQNAIVLTKCDDFITKCNILVQASMMRYCENS